MFSLRSVIIIMQAARLVGLLGISNDVEGIIDNFNLEEICEYDTVSDFLSMDTEEFEERYDKCELYERDILYCTQEAWKYQGEAVDWFQEPDEYYDVEDITAIRFINGYPAEINVYGENNGAEDNRNMKMLLLQYFDDYALSMYFQECKDAQSREEELKLMEVSFLKVKLGEYDRRGVAPKALYEFLEDVYYEVQEELQAGEWAVSPDGEKAVYISNGALPKHPSQIFVRYQGKIPDLIFRNEWEYHFTAWIDEDHFICYNDGGPIMIHLENGQIEKIKQEEDDYDAWGCEYEIKENQLIATCLDEEYYCWDIIREDDDIRITKTENQDEDKED